MLMQRQQAILLELATAHQTSIGVYPSMVQSEHHRQVYILESILATLDEIFFATTALVTATGCKATIRRQK